MIINTKYFGEFTCDEDDIIKFENGLFGFEYETEFVLIHFDNESDTLICLQSTHTGDLAFVVVNPFLLLNSYSPKLSKEDLDSIKADENTKLAFFSICVVHDDIRDTTINLRCPIVINLEKNLSKQVILEDSDYSFKHPFVPSDKKEDAPC